MRARSVGLVVCLLSVVLAGCWGDDKKKADALKDVVGYCLSKGQESSEALGYVPLSDKVVAKVKEAAQQITARDAKAAEIRDRKSEARSQMSEIRGQRSEVRSKHLRPLFSDF